MAPPKTTISRKKKSTGAPPKPRLPGDLARLGWGPTTHVWWLGSHATLDATRREGTIDASLTIYRVASEKRRAWRSCRSRARAATARRPHPLTFCRSPRKKKRKKSASPIHTARERPSVARHAGRRRRSRHPRGVHRSHSTPRARYWVIQKCQPSNARRDVRAAGVDALITRTVCE